VKRFVSLQLLNLRQSLGLLGRGISMSQGLALSGIPTHDPSVRAGAAIAIGLKYIKSRYF
jgi:hypothetical protein